MTSHPTTEPLSRNKPESHGRIVLSNHLPGDDCLSRELPRQGDSSELEFLATWAYSIGVRSPSESWGRTSLYSTSHKLGGLPDIFQPDEQVLVQQLVAQRAIEPLDAGVLVRFARLDVLDRHAIVLRPLRERLTQELRAVVSPASVSGLCMTKLDVLDGEPGTQPPLFVEGYGNIEPESEEVVGVPIDIISAGPDRDHTIALSNPFV